MNIVRNPKTVAPPFNIYSQAVEIPPGARVLFTAGQVGATPEGEIVEGFEAQQELVWQNLINVLADADMGIEDIVRLNTYITDKSYVKYIRPSREKYLAKHVPASTLVVVDALAFPDWLIEMECVAAKTD